MILITIVVFVIILGLLIFVHELGHFLMAKRAGMKVEEFGFGFPPRIFGVKRGETIYSINWIPLGGFVKVLGEDGEAAEDSRSFAAAGFWPRFRVLVAGVVMNLILAWLLFFISLAIFGTPLDVGEGTELGPARIKSESQITVIQIQEKSPAQEVGFKSGDVVVSIDDQKFSSIADMVAYTENHAGESVTYLLKRGEQELQFEVTPRVDRGVGEGPVGFVPAQIAVVTYPFFEALKLSFIAFFSRTVGILIAFWHLISGLLATGQLAQGIAGPVGIAVLTRDFINLGLVYLLQFTAVLSINLAIINGLPFPALDGGRVLFLIIEKIRGAKSKKWEQVANTVGFLLLLLLMVLVTFRDVTRFF